MNSKVLGLLLLVQVALIGAIWFSDQLFDEGATPFLTFDATAVQTIEIAETGQEIEIERLSGDDASSVWQLPDGLPADNTKVNDFIDKLLEAGTADWAVAKTDSAKTRFEVADDNYQRHIRLLEDEEDALAEFYLGTSPGFGKVHMRLQGEDDIYSVNFANHEAPADISDWVDKSLLQPKGRLQFVSRTDAPKGGWRLDNRKAGWKVKQGAGVVPTLDQSLVSDFVNNFKNLYVTEVVPNKKTRGAPAMQFRLKDDNGNYDLSFFVFNPPPDEEDEEAEDPAPEIFVKSSRYKTSFKTAEHLGEALDLSLEALAAKDEDETDDSPQ